MPHLKKKKNMESPKYFVWFIPKMSQITNFHYTTDIYFEKYIVCNGRLFLRTPHHNVNFPSDCNVTVFELCLGHAFCCVSAKKYNS
jgi:hypothetical protein